MNTSVAVNPGPALTVEIEREGRVSRCTCHLLGIGQGEAHLHSEKWIEPGIEVVIHFKLISLTGSVLYCNPKDTGHRICILINSNTESKRREPRFPIMFPGTATIFSGSQTVMTDGTLTDISQSGLGMKLDVAVSVGSMICFENDSFVLAGEVRHCSPVSAGDYKIGVEISDIFEGQPRNPMSARILGVFRRGVHG
jgi:hypothetical protein